MKIGLILAAEGGRCDLPPLGLGFVGASINRSLPDVEVVFKEKLEDLLHEGPDLIGISASTDTYSIAIKWAQTIKAQLGVPVILGGIHISLVPESLASCFDLAVLGEGEITIVEVLRSYQKHHRLDYSLLQRIPGLAYFNNGRLARTAPRPQITDLDGLARPCRELLPYYQKGGQSHVFSARGCPYHCHFCASTKMFARYHSHSVDTIVADIEHLIQVEQAKFITFFDDLFIADKRKLDAIATRLEERGLLGKCQFMGHVRANLIDEAVCQQLKRLRMDVVSMGIESFSDKVLKSLNKTGNSCEVNQRTLDLLAQHGIGVLSLFLFGTPAETAEDVHYTLEQIYRNVEAGKIRDAQWAMLLTYPGTKIWDHAKERGLVSENMDWSLFSGTLGTGDRSALYLGTNLSRPELVTITDEWRAKFTLLVPDRQPDARTNLFFNDPHKLNEAIHAVIRRRGSELGTRLGDSLISNAYDMRLKKDETNRRFYFLKELEGAKLLSGTPEQRAIWSTWLGGRADLALFLHPPAKLKFTLENGGRGRLSFAIAIHPDAWGKPASGACRFLLTVNGALTWERTLNPTLIVEERCWHEYSIEVSPSHNGSHEVIFETQTVGDGATYRWALWRAPRFLSETSPSDSAEKLSAELSKEAASADARFDNTSSASCNLTLDSAAKAVAPKAMDCDLLIKHAGVAFERGDALEARKWLAAAAQETPTRIEQLLELGYLRLNLGDLPEASVWFSHAVQQAPDLAHAHSSRALARALASQPTEAREDAERALALNPKDIVALKVLTRICLDLKDPTQARALSERILKLNAGDADAQAMLAQASLTAPSVEMETPPARPPVRNASVLTASLLERQLGSKLQFVGLELTTRCTFRCTYCTLSSSSWSERDYPFAKLEQVVDEIIAQEVPSVGLSGNGESTMLPYWQDCAKRLIDDGVKVSIISNFDRSFTEEEILVLSRFAGITVSLDTVDYRLARKIRRKGDVNRILMNIARVKAADFGRTGPHFAINVVVADKTVFGLVELVKLGMSVGVKAYFFGAVSMFPKTLPGERMERDWNMFPLDTLSEGERARARTVMAETERVVTQAGGTVSWSVELNPMVSPSPPETPAAVLNHTSADANVDRVPTSPEKRLTRLCLRPWTEVFLRANEDVLPCCYWGAAEASGGTPAKDGKRMRLDGPSIRNAKLSLLSGELLPSCVKCQMFPMVSTGELVTRVNSLLGLSVDFATTDHAPRHFGQEEESETALITKEDQAGFSPRREAIRGASRNGRVSLLDELGGSELLSGDASQVALWQVTLRQTQSRALFLHPPAKLRFTLQGGGRGRLSFAVTIHPDAWGKPGSGACRFLVAADGKLIWERTLNPTLIVEERCWHECNLDIPYSPNGSHEIAFETAAMDAGTTYRWALWRAPQFFSERLPLNTASAQIMNTPEQKSLYNQSAVRTNSGFSTNSSAGASGSPPKTANDWEILIQHATLAYQRGDALEARKGLASAGTESPGSCEQNLELGYLRLNLGDFPEAVVWFSHAVRLSPELAHTHSSRALAFALANQPTEAREDAERALALNPHDIVALKVLTRVCLNLKRPAQARTLCETILKLHPGDPDAQTMLDQSTVTMPVIEADTLSVKLPAADSSAPVFKISKHLQSLEGLLGDYQTRCEAWQGLGVEHLLQQLVVGDFKQAVEIFPAFVPLPAGSDGLPVPPAALTMGYGAGNMDHYLACGRRSYESLTRLLCKHQVELSSGDVMLDWGGAAGRVVRNFVAESQRGCQVWGCDVHAPSIQWAQNHLSPPFKFFNSSALPHLPFPDRTFKFIYGLSVVTHMIALRDLWLLELQRVLRPDGCLILTVHNESTWQWFRDHQMPPWMPADLKELPEMPGECVEIRGSRWEFCYTFFHSDYLRRIWGQYFEIKDIVPCAEGYQTAVVMKPRAS